MTVQRIVATGLSVALFTFASRASAAPIVISQIYGGGGNIGSTLTNDYIELFNPGTLAVSLAGWSLQYASAAGAANLGASTTTRTELPSVFVQPFQYFLVQESNGSGNGTTPLPSPDFIDATGITVDHIAGKIALVNTPTPLGCNGGATPCDAAALAQIIDLVGYGSANFFEGGSAAPAMTGATALFRADGGCTDTNNNGADFASGAPAPRNVASPASPCESVPAVPEPSNLLLWACALVGYLTTRTRRARLARAELVRASMTSREG